MKNKIFNYKLYIDGVKQLKLIGTISTIILSVFAGLITIGQLISSKRDTYDGIVYDELILSLSDITPVNQAIYLLVVPVMCLLLFNFLTKRNQCDFYHALPLKRQGLFLSFYASIMTWVVCMMTVSSLVSIIIVAIIPSMHLIVPSIFIYWLEILATSVLVSSALMIAISLTGTTFTNIMVALMILFVPRTIIAVTAMIIKDFFPYIEITSNGILLNYHNNLLISTFTSLVDKTHYDSTWGPIAYTFILGILYLIVGCYFFVKRKSEVAGNAAANRKLQLVYRLVISFLICLYPCYNIYYAIMGVDEISSSGKFWLFVIYVIAVIVYFLYELLTTKKLENLVEAVPGLGILAGLNIAFIICLSVGTFAIRHTLPDANDIRYFNICSDVAYYQSTNNYFIKASQDIKLTNEDAVTLVADLLEETAEVCQEAPGAFYYGAYTILDIKINTMTGTRNYHLPVSESEYNTLQEHLEQTEEYQKLYTDLLPVSNSYLFVTMDSDGPTTVYNFRDPELSQEAYNRIYESARSELSVMGYDDARNYINNYSGEAIDTLECTVILDEEQYSYTIKISKDLPKTYLKYITEVSNEYSWVQDIIKDYKKNSLVNKNFTLEEIDSFSENFTLSLNRTEPIVGIEYIGRTENDIMKISYEPYDEALSLVSTLTDHIEVVNENIDINNTILLNIYYRYRIDVDNNIITDESLEDFSDDRLIETYFIIDDEGIEIMKQLAALHAENKVTQTYNTAYN